VRFYSKPLMNLRTSRRKLCAAALLCASLSGCKGGMAIPIWNPFAKPSPNPGLTQNGDGSFTQPNMPQTETESGWAAPFKKMGDAITSPFKKSTTNQASKKTPDDSISLASKNAAPSGSLYVSLAKLQERSGNTAAAVEEYNKALDAEPNFLPALLGLARLYDRQGRYDDALKLYRTAAEAHPQNASAQNDLGLCLARSGKLNESTAALRKAMTLEPGKVLYRNNLATVLVEQNKADEAYQVLVGAHGEAVAHYNVGFLLNKRDQKPEALSHFLAAAKLDPNLREAKQWAELLQSGGTTAEAAPTAIAKTPATLAAPSTTTQASATLTVEPIATPVPKLPEETSRPVAPTSTAPAPYPSTEIKQPSAAALPAITPVPLPSVEAVPPAPVLTPAAPATAPVPATDDSGPKLLGNQQARKTPVSLPTDRYPVGPIAKPVVTLPPTATAQATSVEATPTAAPLPTAPLPPPIAEPQQPRTATAKLPPSRY
jgi:tetratricopeptide (TPR) repeat protein